MEACSCPVIARQANRCKGESDSRIMGVMYRDGVICDDLLIREVQDVLIKMGYPHAEVSSEGPGSVLIHDDIQMDQQWRKVQPLLADIPGLLHWQISHSHQSQGMILFLR